MSDSASSLTRTIARQDDLFQASLEFLQKNRKFLNYGYTVSGKETYEERQQRLYLEVFQAAEIGQGDIVIDVGFGSGSRTSSCRTLRVQPPGWLQHLLEWAGSLRRRAGHTVA